MKSPATALLCILFLSLSYSSASEKFSRVRINVPDHATLGQIWSTGIDYEGVTGKIGGPMEFVAGQYEIEQLTRRGVSYQIVVDDLAAEYERSGSAGPHNALGFGVGSMGGHYTYAEALRQLDTMKLQYPNLITVRDSIGRSQEGRGMWIVKISDNPNINEPNEPEVLYTGLHHAREPMGLMSCLYYMWWLLENYGTNPEATYLVNNRQMWFLPVVNPDGYVYNQTTNPNGGGMWRKNRRNNGGSYGVDLNRNYGPYYMWNSQIVPGGSSTDPTSDTYRGPSPFSEPEDTTIDRFMRAHNVKASLNYHTYGNYLINPYGYLARENPDSLIYRDWAYYMTADNRFTNGTDMQTVAYATRGGSDDYMYGDTTKPRAWAMTPEVGITAFWAPLAEILPLAIGNLSMNQYLAHISGQYANLARYVVQDAGGNGFIDRGESFNILTTIKNKGIGAASNLGYTISSNSPSVQFSTSTAQIGSLASQAEALIVFSGSVAWNATTGVPVQFFLTATDPEGYLKIDTLKLYIGTPATVFADSASGGTSNWTTGSGWGVTSNAHTPPSAFTDSPTGNYAASANNSLTLVGTLNLTGYNYAQLKFWTMWAMEPTWDFATAEVSTNNGSTWTTLRTALSHKGSARSGSQQPAGSWGYDSYTPFGQQYIEQDADLTPYRGSQVKIRFRVAADGGDQRDGFYVDDIRIFGFTTNQLPDTGVIVRPSSFTFTGVAGRVYRDSIKINNYTPGAVLVSIAETTATFAARPSVAPGSGKLDLQTLIKRLRPAFEKAHLTRESFQKSTEVLSDDPDVYTTIITDERNENSLGAADIFSVQYQYRTNILGSFHDFKIVMAVPPDTNVVVVLSLDTDQDFGTGSFPTPLGIGSTTRDIGSEFEVLLDASGVLIDSLTPLGRIPAGIAFSTANDTTTLVGIPFLLTIQRDSVLTISTESSFGGINASWLSDPDRKMNIGFVATRLSQGASPIPDFAPAIGHATIGTETGVSWLSENRTSVTISSGDSTFVRVSAVGAKLPGTYNATLKLSPTGRPTTNIPVQLNVTALAQPHIVLNATSYRDTVRAGDSTMHTLNISNTGNADLIWGILDTSNTAWITAVPAYGSTPAGQSGSTTITFRSSGLAPNTTYTSRLLILNNDQLTGTIVLPISLRVTPISDVGEQGKSIPTSFALRQNYPNPFNPETNISFDLPKSTFVTLRLFNLIGQEVGTLVNGQLPAGTHNVVVGGEKFGLTSGVYFYRLSAGDFVQTRKMVLLR